jgi:HK97 family phage portal protein
MVVLSDGRDPIRTPQSYDGYSKEGYRKNVIAFRCINLIADAVASVPWLLYRLSASGKRAEVHSHPVLGLLTKPNPTQSGAVFQRQLMSYFLLSGNGFVHAPAPRATGGKPGEPGELWALQPNLMRVVPGQGGIPAKYEYRPGFNLVEFTVDVLGRSPILHMKTFNPHTFWEGMSPIEAAALGVDTLNAGGLWNLRLMQNSARPSLLIKIEGQVSAPQFEQLKKDVEANYEGAWRAGKPMILQQADAKPLSFNPTDMDWLQAKGTSEKDVALCFGVPGQLVGVQDSQKFENYAQARLAFFQDTVLPLKKMQAEALGAWLLPAYRDGATLELGWDDEKVDALEPLREKRWERAQKTDFITANEKREMVGYGRYLGNDSAEPADRLMVATSMIPIESAAADLHEGPVTGSGDQGLPEVKPADETEPVKPSPEVDENQVEGADGKSQASRRAYWMARDRAKLAAARGVQEKARALFSAESQEMQKRLTGVTPQLHELVIRNVLAEHRPKWEAMLKASLTDIARRFGEELIGKGKDFSPAFETKGAREKFEFSIARFLEARIASTTERMSATTTRRLTNALKDAEERDDDGHIIEIDAPEVVKDSYESWEESRSDAIARTETHVAAEEGTLAAAKAMQIPAMKKEWVAVKDNRVRDSHADINGTRVELDETFTVKLADKSGGTEEMTGPGDKNASPGNTINCRCVLAFVTGEE